MTPKLSKLKYVSGLEITFFLLGCPVGKPWIFSGCPRENLVVQTFYFYVSQMNKKPLSQKRSMVTSSPCQLAMHSDRCFEC